MSKSISLVLAAASRSSSTREAFHLVKRAWRRVDPSARVIPPPDTFTSRDLAGRILRSILDVGRLPKSMATAIKAAVDRRAERSLRRREPDPKPGDESCRPRNAA